jgi:hypothetical protein
VLANRIQNVVERHRTAQEAERLGILFEALYHNPSSSLRYSRSNMT